MTPRPIRPSLTLQPIWLWIACLLAPAVSTWADDELRKKVEPYARKIEQTRLLFHINMIPIQSRVGELERAMRELSKLEAEGKQSAYFWYTLGLGRWMTGDPTGAETALHKAEAIIGDGKQPTGLEGQVSFYLGRIYFARYHMPVFLSGRKTPLPAAESDRKKALAYFARKPPHEEKKIRRVLRQMFLEICKEDYKAVRRIHRSAPPTRICTPASSLLHMLRGFAPRGPGEREIYWQAAVIHRPHGTWIRARLGVFYYKQAKLTEALAEYTRALAADPNLAGVRNNQGVVLLAQGKRRAAGQTFRRALRKNRKLAVARANLGLMMIADGRRDAAITWLNSAIEHAPAEQRETFRALLPK